MSINNIAPKLLSIGNIHGEFTIPSYQRGYRWGTHEVEQLLNDIFKEAEESKYCHQESKYCLQPVVVSKINDDHFEVIDGQQRLTTLYLIYQCMNSINKYCFNSPKFSIKYETRERSGEFLKSNNNDMERSENIDFWFMANAKDRIDKWFGEKDDLDSRNKLAMIISQYLQDNVMIIWYEVEDMKPEERIALFERLNIGKIPLTNAELVKAMFLSNKSGLTESEKMTIALQWDNIENSLNDNMFWSFLTNPEKESFQTKIDLILQLIVDTDKSKKEDDAGKSGDSYRTFFYFIEQIENKGNKEKKEKILQLWNEILRVFLKLQDWYENTNLYNKIGYLIATKTYTLADIFENTRDKKKKEIEEYVENCIKDVIQKDQKEKTYGEMRYGDDNEEIIRLLLLFNIQSMNMKGFRFPFDQYKGKKISLEHIHAQMSEGLKNERMWKTWVQEHISFVSNKPDSKKLIETMNKLVQKGVTQKEFQDVQDKVFKLIPEHSRDVLHSIDNLALLSVEGNSTLSNAIFSVKRDRIIEMDCKGEYIPYCTKMVFLKYYTSSEQAQDQIYFWSPSDRKAYIDAINKTLETYLNGKIEITEEGLDT